MSHPLLAWIAERSWFVRELSDGKFLFESPDGGEKVGCFPGVLVEEWIEQNPHALGGSLAPDAIVSEGLESLAVQIDEVLTLDKPRTKLQGFGLKSTPDGIVEWFEEWVPSGDIQTSPDQQEEPLEPLGWTSHRPTGSSGSQPTF